MSSPLTKGHFSAIFAPEVLMLLLTLLVSFGLASDVEQATDREQLEAEAEELREVIGKASFVRLTDAQLATCDSAMERFASGEFETATAQAQGVREEYTQLKQQREADALAATARLKDVYAQLHALCVVDAHQRNLAPRWCRLQTVRNDSHVVRRLPRRHDVCLPEAFEACDPGASSPKCEEDSRTVNRNRRTTTAPDPIIRRPHVAP